MKMGASGCGNTETGCICILASTCGIVGRGKGLVSHKVGAKAGQARYEAGLPRWPILPLGDHTREFGHLIKELRAGVISSRTTTCPGES